MGRGKGHVCFRAMKKISAPGRIGDLLSPGQGGAGTSGEGAVVFPWWTQRGEECKEKWVPHLRREERRIVTSPGENPEEESNSWTFLQRGSSSLQSVRIRHELTRTLLLGIGEKGRGTGDGA